MDIKKKINDAIRWVKYRTTERHHIINISGMDGYDKGWIDKDHAMYLACFKLLCDFVESEDSEIGRRGWQDYAWSSMTQEDIDIIQAQIDREKEIRSVYLWWKFERPYAIKQLERIVPDDWWNLNTPSANYKMREYFDETERLKAIDDEMFDRLMRVRKYLWT